MTFIKLFVDYLDAIEPLGDAERGRLFTALLEYTRTGEAPQLCGNERFLFPMMRAQIDRDEAAMSDISEARSAAGKKGAKAKLSKYKQTKQMPNLPSKSSEDKEEDKDEDKDIFPLSFPPEEEEEAPLDFEFVEEQVKENISYDVLLEKYGDSEVLSTILRIITDTLCHQGDMKINGCNMPEQMVKKRFRRLDIESISSVIDKLFEIKLKDIKNPRAFIFTMLYNGASIFG